MPTTFEKAYDESNFNLLKNLSALELILDDYSGKRSERYLESSQEGPLVNPRSKTNIDTVHHNKHKLLND